MQDYDVAVVGGGPAGSTLGSYLKVHDPDLKVVILEREVFPRDHVGESQLPIVCTILEEIGAWDKVEAAGFPVKIGATYRWGTSDDLWDFNFLPNGNFKDEPRPALYQGQRTQTAFQVDRSVYDKILLDHAEGLGCEVRQGTGVRGVEKTHDQIDALVLEDGSYVKAKFYVDASGHLGILRRSMGTGIQEPSSLKNIAVWDYWQDAEWAVSLGVGGTRVQVMSLGYGWLWFIPVGETRTSIGLVCPAEYYKKSGLKPEELYLKAVGEDPRVSKLTANATREMKVQSTKDWSFVADRLYGENWVLIGEAAGFADPVLAAGMAITQVSSKEAAFTLMEIFKGGDKDWLLSAYSERTCRKVGQHIRFADYWYSTNAHFSDLKEYTSEIAKDAGLELDPEAAFRWLGTGGFVEEDMEVGGIAGFRIDSLHQLASRFSKAPSKSTIDQFSGFPLVLAGAETIHVPVYEKGRVHKVTAYRRDGKILPMVGFFELMTAGLKHSPRLDVAITYIARSLASRGVKYDAEIHGRLVQTLEAMSRDGWVKCERIPGAAPITAKFDHDTAYVQTNTDDIRVPERVAPSLRSEK